MPTRYTVYERKEIADALWRIFQLDATKILFTYEGDEVSIAIHLKTPIQFDDGRLVKRVQGVIKGDTRYFENVTVIEEVKDEGSSDKEG